LTTYGNGHAGSTGREEKRGDRYRIALGVATGIPVVLFDNLALGIAIGVALGVAFGAWEHRRRRETDNTPKPPGGSD
jgi:hypothetical protein